MNLPYASGQEAEKRAIQWFLEQKTGKILTHNYRCRRGEIDFIFEETFPDGNAIELVFVEVRVRAFEGWVSGSESITQKKQKNLVRAARRYLMHYKGPATTLRFDLLSWDGKEWEYLPNIWLRER